MLRKNPGLLAGVFVWLEVPTRFELVHNGFCRPLPYHLATAPKMKNPAAIKAAEVKNGAAYEARTRYLHLGKVALYQMS